MRASRPLLLSAFVLVALGAAGLVSSLDPMARRAVETQTTAALNLRTTVASVTVHALTSRVGFNDFRIASPDGFETPDMLVLPSAEMEIAFAEFRNEPAHIKSIVMKQPRLVIEGNGRNINLKKMAEQIPVAINPAHLVIDQVTVQDALVVLRNLPGVKGEITIPVETFTVTGLGADHPGGALIKDAVTQLVTTLAVHACDSPQMPAQYRAWIKGDIGQLVRMAVPGHVGRILSGLLGGHDPQGPAPAGKGPKGPFDGFDKLTAGKLRAGLFGFGRNPSGTTRPDE